MTKENLNQNQDKSETDQEVEEELLLKNSMLWLVVIAIAFVILVYIALKSFGVLGSASQYKVVDLVTITSTLKDKAREAALKDGVSEEQQGLILEGLQKQMNSIEPLIDAEAQLCSCTIFVKSAVVADGAQTEDITQIILNKIRK